MFLKSADLDSELTSQALISFVKLNAWLVRCEEVERMSRGERVCRKYPDDEVRSD